MASYLLIPHSTEPRVFLLFGQDGCTLPWVDLPEASDRQAVSLLNQTVRARFGMHLTVLRCISCRSEPKQESAQRVYVLENHSPGWITPAAGQWVDRAEFLSLSLAIPAHRDILNAWFREVHEGGNLALRRPWAQAGWLERAIAWIHRQIDRLGLAPIGPVTQLRTWERSCVLQVDTDSQRLYFKAVPSLFAHEPKLTQALAARYPVHLPQILALDAEQGWLLMADFGGQSLNQIQDVTYWQSALRDYAKIQIDLTESMNQLRHLGCPERRLDKLAAQIDPLLAELSTVPPEQGLSPGEMAQLYALAPELKAMCAQLASYRVPHTLEHGDFHARNIIFTGRSPLYFDWSDSAIAHPFFSLSLFFRSIEPQGYPVFSAVRPDLRHAYLEAWTAYEPMQRLIEAFELAQTLEVLHHAITYHQILLPSVEDKSLWAAIAPSHLKTLLCNSR